jgi:glycosyltransferase involved in cell wall biosynthesis
VATAVGGIPEQVIDGETGFLVTPHRPTEMAERILFLLNNEAVRSKMGHLAQQRSNDFSMQRMLEKVRCVYEELLLVVPSVH